MKVLIFGGNGLVGVALQKFLKEKNVEFHSASRKSGIDISNIEDFTKLQRDDFDIVVNLATTLPGGDYLDSDYLEKIYKVNILGVQNICKWITGQNTIKKIINASTLVVNKKPWKLGLTEEDCRFPTGNHVLYSCSKLFQESILSTFSEKNNIPIAHLRFSAVYGKGMPKQGILIDFLNKAANNYVLNLKNGTKVSADFINVYDVASVIYEACIQPVTGVLNVASGEETFVEDLAKIAVRITNSSSIISNTEEEKFLEDRAVINISKLKTFIDADKFIKLEDGLKALIK